MNFKIFRIISNKITENLTIRRNDNYYRYTQDRFVNVCDRKVLKYYNYMHIYVNGMLSRKSNYGYNQKQERKKEFE